MPKAKVEIDQETARYYLQLENAFARLVKMAIAAGINLNSDAEVFWAINVDPNLAYGHRVMMHDNLQKAMRMKDRGIEKNQGVKR